MRYIQHELYSKNGINANSSSIKHNATSIISMVIDSVLCADIQYNY